MAATILQYSLFFSDRLILVDYLFCDAQLTTNILEYFGILILEYIRKSWGIIGNETHYARFCRIVVHLLFTDLQYTFFFSDRLIPVDYLFPLWAKNQRIERFRKPANCLTLFVFQVKTRLWLIHLRVVL